MLNVTEFIVGELYTNDQIGIALRVENLGGVRPSVDDKKDLRHIAIMTKTEQANYGISDNPYHDRIESNILIYTAQGRTGDQSMSGRNKRIVEQYAKPIPIYCFANQGRQSYSFLGMLELLRHYQETQVDSARQLRKVWVFEFMIHTEFPVVAIDRGVELMLTVQKSKPAQEQTREEREIVTEEELPEDVTEILNIEEIRWQLLRVAPIKFEHLVRDVIEACGFQNVTVTTPSQDPHKHSQPIGDKNRSNHKYCGSSWLSAYRHRKSPVLCSFWSYLGSKRDWHVEQQLRYVGGVEHRLRSKRRPLGRMLV